MDFLDRLADWVAPNSRNSYRPRLLHKHGLALFLAVALVGEAYFVSGIFGVNPAQPFLAAAGVAATPAAADWVLVAVAAVLAIALAAAVLAHAHIQPGELLLPGFVILGIVILLLALNAWYAVAYG